MHWPTFSPNKQLCRRASLAAGHSATLSAAISASLLAGLCLTPSAALAQNTIANWEAGISHQHFDYEETLPGGRTLNTEKGWLPGFYVSGSLPLPKNFELTARVSRAKGSADYEGATQAGRALSTQTTETLTSTGAELATPLPVDSLSGVIGVSYTRWNRKIQPASQSGELFEHYRWYELSGGVRHCATPSLLRGIEQLCLSAKLTRTLGGTVVVRLNDLGLGNPELELGDAWGGEADLTLRIAGAFTLRAYAKTWNHRASEPVIVRQPTGAIRITEPASQSWLTGFEAGIRF